MTYIPGTGSSSSIATSSDVALSNPSTNQVLIYDGSIGKWKNSTVSVNSLQEEINNIRSRIEVLEGAPGSGGGTNSSLGPNPTFDVDISGWNASANTALAHSTVNTKSGTGCLKLTSMVNGAISAYSNKFNVTAGSSYDAIAGVRSEVAAGSVGLQIDWYDAANVYISSSMQYVAGTTSWSERSVASAIAPAGASVANLKIVFNTTTAGQVFYADDCYMTVSPQQPTAPDPVTVLWRPDLSQGLNAFKAEGFAYSQYASTPTVSDSPDPTGRVYRASIADGSSDYNPKFMTRFSAIPLTPRQDITASMDIRFRTPLDLSDSPSKQAWGLGHVPDNQSVWYTSTGGSIKPDSWSVRYTHTPANRLSYKFGDHPVTLVAYIYAVSAEGWTPQSSTNGYGIEIPFRSGLGNGKTGTFYDLSQKFDQWIHLDMRVKANTPGVSDGIVEMWADGVLWVQANDVLFCQNGYSAPVNEVVSHSFFNDPTSPGGNIDHANLLLKTSS